MKLSREWLGEYTTIGAPDKEYCDAMTMSGSKVEGWEVTGSGIERVVVGRVVSMERHTNSDHMWVCRIDVGGERELQIVTGAQNVSVGDLVPVALDGSTLPGGKEIHTGKLRGELSEGMLCSLGELGLEQRDFPYAIEDGIFILEEDCIPGDDIRAVCGLNDSVVEFEITNNRPDCLSVRGLARESACTFRTPLTLAEPTVTAGHGDIHEKLSVEIKDAELCPRYTARMVKNIKIAPSPKWMRRRLRASGVRPINNIVDITNYVLVEYGHPMHAFDLACVAEGHIIVRNARENETVVTLDGKERAVTPEMLLIADPEKGVGIAGVMGGENSEITAATKATLFEAAAFKGSNIRATTRKLRHVTDAAARFIKGVEPVNAYLALARAIELVDDLHAGKVIGEAIDVCAADISPRVIDVDYAHVNKILNTDITPEDMVKMLATINIPSEVCGDKLRVDVPHYRTDIESGIEADWDIAEEVGRIYGYDNIPPTLMRGNTFRGRIGDDLKDEDAIKDLLVAQGCCEMYNYNFTGPAALDALRIPEGDEKRLAVKLLNPFGEDQSLMRTTLLAGALDSLARNFSRKTGQTRFFEVGNVHFDNNADLPEERKLLGVAFSGAGEDFFTLKGSLEALLASFNMHERCTFVPGGGECFQPGQKALLLADGEPIGELGAIHPKVQKAWGIPEKVYYAEINVEKLRAHKGGKRTYEPLPRFPKVPRDIAVVVDETVSAAAVKEAIEQAPAAVAIGDVELFDVYRGAGIPAGKKSMAYSFALSASDHTLNDDEIQQAMKCVIEALAARLGAQLRA